MTQKNVPTTNSLLGADFGFTQPANAPPTSAADLQFQSFPHQSQSDPITSTSANIAQIPVSSDKGPATANVRPLGRVINLEEDSDSLGHDSDRDKLLPRASPARKAGSPIWDLGYWAQYFSVNTDQVIERILYSVAPGVGLNRVRPMVIDPLQGGSGPDSSDSNPGSLLGTTYIDKHISNNPDLWGPFWISTTLVFSIAIFGNMASYLAATGRGDPTEWHYDFTKVAAAATTIALYITIVPLILWFFSWFRGCAHMYSLLETICAYGYSLSIYVPISFLWIIQWRPLQYSILIVGSLLSGSVLVHSFTPVVQSDPSRTIKSSYALLIVIIALHALLALSFLTYFF